MGKKTKADPTGQRTNRIKGTKATRARLTRAERQVKALFREIPRTRRTEAVIVNAERTVIYDYQITPEQTEALEAQIRAIVDTELLETTSGRMPFDWWWKANIEQVYRQGTLEEAVEFNRLVAEAIGAGILVRGLRPRTVDTAQLLQSFEYIERLQGVYVDNWGDFTTLSNRTADQVIQRINQGISAGASPTEITDDIAERFGVARSGAKRTVDTAVNKAYNDARLDASDALADQTGMRVGVIHISALLPDGRTRESHARRHGNAYTTSAQRQWWNTGTNRINCHCTTRTVLIDNAGNLIDTELQEQIKAERAFFDLDS